MTSFAPLLYIDSLFYTPPHTQKELFSGFSCTCFTGEVIGLAGMNGTGKTTFLHLLAGLLEPSAGSLKKNITPTRSCDVALLVQDADMQIIGATVGEDILLSARMHVATSTLPLAQHEQVARELAQASLQPFGLLELWDSPVQQLSFGQKRKLCLATALIMQPEMLLLDEPCNGLDYPACLELFALLHMYKKNGGCIIVSAHDFSPWYGLLDRIILLSPNEPPHIGSREQILPLLPMAGVFPVCTPTEK